MDVNWIFVKVPNVMVWLEEGLEFVGLLVLVDHHEQLIGVHEVWNFEGIWELFAIIE